MIRAHPKKKRVKSNEYLAFLRKKRCVVTGHIADVHHLVSRGSGGSDYFAVPLSREMHTLFHLKGEIGFFQKTGVNLWREAAQLIVEFYEKGAENS